jgi:ubiquinone biosynthesis protein
VLPYVQLGQILAAKSDMLPPEYTSALSALYDSMPPAPFEAIQGTMQQELKAPVQRHFAALDPEPLATASIAQVGAAEWRASCPAGSLITNLLHMKHAGVRLFVEGQVCLALCTCWCAAQWRPQWLYSRTVLPQDRR